MISVLTSGKKPAFDQDTLFIAVELLSSPSRKSACKDPAWRSEWHCRRRPTILVHMSILDSFIVKRKSPLHPKINLWRRRGKAANIPRPNQAICACACSLLCRHNFKTSCTDVRCDKRSAGLPHEVTLRYYPPSLCRRGRFAWTITSEGALPSIK